MQAEFKDVFNYLAGFVNGALIAQEGNRFEPEIHFPIYLRPAVMALMESAHAKDENCKSAAEKWPRAANIVQFEMRQMERELKVPLLLGDWSARAFIEVMK